LHVLSQWIYASTSLFVIAAPVLNEDETYAGFLTMNELIDFWLELVDETGGTAEVLDRNLFYIL